MSNIVLIGFMGTGKTAVGRTLARRLGRVFIDTDEEIEKSAGITIREIFRRYGQEYFRSLEKEVVNKVSSFDNLVIATGGGVVLEPANVTALKSNGIMILLRCSPEVILKRVDAAGSRPLLAGAKDLKGRIKELLSQREAAYARAADFEVVVEGEDLEAVAVRIIELLKERE